MRVEHAGGKQNQMGTTTGGIKNKDKSCGSGVTKVNQITVARKHAAPRMSMLPHA